MSTAVKKDKFQKLSAAYFAEKAAKVKGPKKLLIMLEMSKYLTNAREHGLTFEDLISDGFRFATLPDPKYISMPSTTTKPKQTIRTKRRSKAEPMTKLEMVQKMLADQKFIREAIQNGVTFQELKDKYGYKFATV